MGPSIQVHQLSKRFRRSPFGSRRTLRAWLSNLGRTRDDDNVVQALDGISFALDGGEVMAIIGANGSGKSTLLRLVGGVGLPDQGTIETHGRFGALLELGTGGDADLSGRDNIIIGGVIAGLSREETIARVQDIAAFAEIEDFLDSPVRTYSTGMQMRLAFATIVFSDPEILLVDEVLAVGDLAFQQKCLKKINELRDRGVCILLASHDLDQVGRLCDRALWLEGGRQRMLDDPHRVVEEYRRKFGTTTIEMTPALDEYPGPVADATGRNLVLGETRLGSQEVKIVAVCPRDVSAVERSDFASEEPVEFVIEYDAISAVDGLIVGVTIANNEGRICIDVNSGTPDDDRRIPGGKGRAVLKMSSLDLRPGKYSVSVGLYERSWAYAYDYHWNAYDLSVTAGASRDRARGPECLWQVGKED